MKSVSLTCHMISYVMTAVDMGMSSVGGSPIVATLRTPPVRGVSWATAADRGEQERERQRDEREPAS